MLMAHGHTKPRINKIHLFKDFNGLFQKESKILLMESTEIQADNHTRVSLQIRKLTLCQIRVVHLVHVKVLQELNNWMTYAKWIFETQIKTPKFVAIHWKLFCVDFTAKLPLELKFVRSLFLQNMHVWWVAALPEVTHTKAWKKNKHKSKWIKLFSHSFWTLIFFHAYLAILTLYYTWSSWMSSPQWLTPSIFLLCSF